MKPKHAPSTPAQAVGLVAAPVAGLLVGLVAVAVAERGAGNRPALSVLILVLAVAAALAPLRFGLPIAIVLAGLEGFMKDFAGGPALYWNEVFIALLVARTLLLKRPSRFEVFAAAALAALFLGYLATESKAIAVFWGAKVLVTSAVAGWALGRMRGAGEREWHATFLGLASLVVASVVLAGWQRHEGVAGLRALGIPLDGGPRLTPSGGVRAFAGFTSASPFAYALALALLCWLALLLRRDLRLALGSFWVPALAVVGIVWSHNRLTPIALGAAVTVVGVAAGLRRRPALIGLATAALVAGAGIFFFSPGIRERVRSVSDFRTSLWSDYLGEFTLGGRGPATAGSAFPHGGFPRWVPPLRFEKGWTQTFPLDGAIYRRMDTSATMLVTAVDVSLRPRLVLVGGAEGQFRPRRLIARLGDRTIVDAHISGEAFELVRIVVPGGHGTARLRLLAHPPAQATTQAGPPYASVTFKNLAIHGLPQPRTSTLRVFQRVWLRTAAPEASLGGITPGVVDNQYVSWLYQYGLLGLVLCALWLGLLLLPLIQRLGLSVHLAAGLAGVFMAVAALGVNVWEESPTDLLAALVIGQALAGFSRLGGLTGGRGRSRRTDPSATLAP